MVVHTSATGAGHRMAAKALVEALQEHPGVEAESQKSAIFNPSGNSESRGKSPPAWKSKTAMGTSSTKGTRFR